MRANEHTRLIGQRTILVPYQEHHVLVYHKWMQNAELRELTASEPLSLDEEYAMQQSWLKDEDKCTFIVLDRQTFDETNCDEVMSMIGDVNLFLSEVDSCRSAEIEIMIAQPSSRGRGIGLEATLAMMSYGLHAVNYSIIQTSLKGIKCLNIQQFTAKIGYSNRISQIMFQKIGFVEESHCDVFQEVTLRLAVDERLHGLLEERIGDLMIVDIPTSTITEFDSKGARELDGH